MGIDLKNWMQNLPDGSDLLALNLCGTHDCVTQHIRLPHFFCCQDLTIYEQLLLGVRALDIRVRADGKCLPWCTAYSPPTTTPATEPT